MQHTRMVINYYYVLTLFFKPSIPLYSIDFRSSNVGMYSNLVKLLLFSWFTFIQALQPSAHSFLVVVLMFWSDIGLLVVVVVISGIVEVGVVIGVGVEQGWPLHIFLFLEQKLKINQIIF